MTIPQPVQRLFRSHRASSWATLCALSLLVVLVTSFSLGPTDAVWAAGQSKGPSWANPENALWVNFVGQTGEWRTKGAELYKQISQSIKEMEQPGDVGVRKFEEAYAKYLQLERIATRLTNYGEPAGEDFALRARFLNAELRSLGNDLAERTEMKRDIERRISGLAKAISVAAKKAEPASKLLANGKIEEACDYRFRITEPVVGHGVWHEIVNGNPHGTLLQWKNLRKSWLLRLLVIEKEKAKQVAIEWSQRETAAFDNLLSQINVASSAIASAGTFAPEDGDALQGPQAVARFGELWVQTQIQAYRWRSVTAVRTALGGQGIRMKSVDDALAKFSQAIGPALAKIIEADAQRAAGDDAAALYDAYLQVLPPIVSRSTELDSLKVFVPALDKLASKSPELAAELQVYRACTNDLLRWRQRTTEAYVRALQNDFPSLIEEVRAARKTSGFPILSTRKRETIVLLQRQVPEDLAALGDVFLTRKITTTDLLGRGGQYVVSRYSDRAISFVPINTEWFQSGYDILAADLFSPGDSVAPTLEAQLALYTARQGDLVSCGGDIANVGLMGWPTRYITLDEDDRGLVRLGPFLPEPQDIRSIDLMILFMVRPAWLAHRYFFVPLAPDPGDPGG